MIKAIMFDFFGVIFSDSYWDFVGVNNQSNSQFRDVKDQVNLGQIQWPQFIHRLAEMTNKTVEEVNQLYQTERLDPRMVDYIHNLHKSCKVALLTNASHTFIESMVDRAHIRDLFDDLVVSSRVGYMKPDPRIYSYALEKLGVSAAEAIMVDDNPRNVESAVNLGMKGIVYGDFDKFVTEMASYQLG